MALENLLITVKRKIGSIKVDGVITESTDRKMRVTTNPIESGANISDHVIEEPLRYSMTGVITDSPLGAAAFSQIAGSVVSAANGIFGEADGSRSTRSKQAYQELVTLMLRKELITVETGLETYDDLIFESISVNSDKDTANGISFSATFVQALIVTSARNIIDRDFIDGDEDKAAYSSFSNGGFQGSTAPTAQEENSYNGSIGL